jgi:hypothetical protein
MTTSPKRNARKDLILSPSRAFFTRKVSLLLHLSGKTKASRGFRVCVRSTDRSARLDFCRTRPVGPCGQTSAQPGPCFPVVLVGALHSMRFSVNKTALATLSSAAKGGSKGQGWGTDTKHCGAPEARHSIHPKTYFASKGAAPPVLGR